MLNLIPSSMNFSPVYSLYWCAFYKKTFPSIWVSLILLLAIPQPLMQILLEQNSCSRLGFSYIQVQGHVIKIYRLSQFPSIYYRCYGISWIKKAVHHLPASPWGQVLGSCCNPGRLGQEGKRHSLGYHAWQDSLTSDLIKFFAFFQFLIYGLFPFCLFTYSCDKATLNVIFSCSWCLESLTLSVSSS